MLECAEAEDGQEHTHLIAIEIFQNGIEHSVEIIQKVDHFDRTTQRGDGGESDDVGEVDRHAVVPHGFDCFTRFETVCNASEENISREKGRKEEGANHTAGAFARAVCRFFSSPLPIELFVL